MVLAIPELGEFLTLGRAPGAPAVGVGGSIPADFLGLLFHRLSSPLGGQGEAGQPFHTGPAVGGRMESVSRHMFVHVWAGTG